MAQPITPDSAEKDYGESSCADDLDQRLLVEEAQRDARQSAEALEHLIEGVRIVKRMLERSTSDNSYKSPTAAAEANGDRFAEEAYHLSELSKNLHGVLGSDLLGLVNAADMVREHAKLAATEASVLVQDVHSAHEAAASAKKHAQRAEKVSRKLYNENLALRQETAQLRRERHVLVKEVKALRGEAEETRKFDTWRLLEEHLLDSMALHEMILKSPTAPKLNTFDEDILVDVWDNAGTQLYKENISLNSKGVGNNSETSQQTQVKPEGSASADRTESVQQENKAQSAPEPTKPVNPNIPKTKEDSQQAGQIVRGIGFGRMAGFRSAFGGGAGLGYGKKLRVATAQQDVDDKPSMVKPEESEPKSDSVNKTSDDCASKAGTDAKSLSNKSEEELPTKGESVITPRTSASPARNGNKSPLPSLAEATTGTEDSLSEVHTSATLDDHNVEKGRLIMPRNVSFKADGKGMGAHLASPLLTPDGSPAGVGTPDLKPICDPKILRTLSIPSGEDVKKINYRLPSPRTCVGHGLYEV
jgi:hypothetical protein